MGKTEYAGIDYGFGKANIDRESGIRYGVISQHAVGQSWYDDSEPYYGPTECECGVEVKETEDSCPKCNADMTGVLDFAEPISHYFEDKSYSAECGEDGDIFIVKSPYFTYAQFCSPCAPGAGHLENPLAEPIESNRTYCLGHEWFEDEKAPYPVYSIKTGKLVNP